MYRLLLPLILVAALPAMAQSRGTAPLHHLAAETGSRTDHVAAKPVSLTLQSALSKALETNADLAAAKHELHASDGAALQASALPNPVLELSAEDRQRATRETTVVLNQLIELGGKRGARMRAAEREKELAAAALSATRAEIRFAVTAAFFEVLAAQEGLRLAEESAQLAQRAAGIVSRQVDAGRVSPVAETRARVAEATIRLELQQARSDLSAVRRRLAATWGEFALHFDIVEGSIYQLPALSPLDMLISRLPSAPALARAASETQRRKALAQLESSRRVPDMTVSVGVKRSEELDRHQAIIGVSIPIPVFDTNRGNVLEALRRTDKARAEMSATELRLRGELAQAHAELEMACNEAETLRVAILPGAQSAYEAAAKGFEFGKFGFLDVLDAQRTLLQARLSHLRALSAAHRSAADIDRILGQPTHETQQ